MVEQARAPVAVVWVVECKCIAGVLVIVGYLDRWLKKGTEKLGPFFCFLTGGERYIRASSWAALNSQLIENILGAGKISDSLCRAYREVMATIRYLQQRQDS